MNTSQAFPLRSTIRRIVAKRMHVPQIPFALEHLAGIGFKPNLVFDVGAYKGEFAEECLRIWPQAEVVCFEALEEKVKLLEQKADKNPSLRVVSGLLGAKSAEKVAFNESETASSVLAEHIDQHFDVKYYPMRTIDEFVSNRERTLNPQFIKLDVQGYELEVLKGAEKTLDRAEVLLAELNLIDLHKGAPLLGEMIDWLGRRNWVAYDICGLTRRPLDNALWQADFVFVHGASRFRQDKRWRDS